MFQMLLVEDESLTRNGIVQALQWDEIGITTILQADDGVKALDIVRRERPDILLTDVRMPHMDGIELCMRLQVIHPACKIIFMSGYSDKEYLKSAIQLQALHFIDKPIVKEELERICREAVNRCRRELESKDRSRMSERLIHLSLPVVRNDAAWRLTRPQDNESLLREWIEAGILPQAAERGGITVLLQFALSRNEDFRRVMNVITRRLLDSNRSFVSGSRDGDTVILHLFVSYVEEAEIGCLIRECCVEAGCALFLCAIGSKAECLLDFGRSHTDAVSAHQRLFFSGYGHVAIYDHIRRPVYEDTDGQERIFGDMIAKRNSRNARNAITRLTWAMKKHDGTPVHDARLVYYKWACLLLRYAESSGLYAEEEARDLEQKVWMELSALHTLQETEGYLLELLEKTMEALDRYEQDQNNLYRIYQYIREHYNDCQLSVKQVAEHVYLSPAYMCTYFKQQTGITIHHYITEHRMTRARELLRDSQTSIANVAMMAGYQDSNYFTKLFRKSTGVSPTEYRERMIRS